MIGELKFGQNIDDTSWQFLAFVFCHRLFMTKFLNVSSLHRKNHVLHRNLGRCLTCTTLCLIFKPGRRTSATISIR